MDHSHLRFGSGKAVARMEDEALVQGKGVYTDDVTPAGTQRIVFVRSPHPHADIVGIRTDVAQKMSGVRLILTGQDLIDAGVKPMPALMNFKRADGSAPGSAPKRLLSLDRVRYVGEPVVCVVADTLQNARNAAEAVEVDYKPLPSVVNPADALASDAPLLSDNPDNISAQSSYGDAQATQKIMDGAAHVVDLEITHQRLNAMSIEPRSVLAYIDNHRLTIRMSTQMPSGIRTNVCDLLGIDPKDVRVIVGDVGGGFGMKTGPYPEDLVVAYCSKHLQCPVKWIADRGEDFLSSSHGRNIHTHAQMALDNNGKILALRVHSLANVGAYPSMTGLAIQLMIGPWVQTSVYDIGLIDFQFKTVLTNTMNTGAYRGAGRPEAIYNIERLMDEAARQIGMDRIELRRINFVQLSQMPYRNPMGQTYDVGQFEAVMNSGLELSQWNSFESRAAQSAKKGLWRGLGVSTFLEWTGGNALEESVQVRILPDGTIEVFSAVIAMGQGIATSLAQLVVDIFDVPLSQIKIVLGDTDRGNGFGSAGSRSLFTGGSAVSMGAQQTLEKARELTAKDLEVSPQDLRYENAKFVVPGTDLQRTLGQIAATQPNQTIEVDSKTTSSGPTWPNGCHVCEVEIDPQTGEVTLDRYSSVNDVGRVVNPTIVRGQLDGGAIQGIGQALCENMVYDEQSGQLLTGSLMDYAVPRADILPKQMLTEMDERTPSTNNVLGVKGVGELGTIGATPCVVNAIADALARNGRAQACKQLQMPLTSEKIWSLINWH